MAPKGLTLNPDDDDDPQVFSCMFLKRPWKIDDLSINGKTEVSGLLGGNGLGWLIGRRTRLVSVYMRTSNVYQWPWRSVTALDVQRGGDVRLSYDDGSQVKFHVHLKGPGLVDIAGMAGAFGDNDALRLIGYSKVQGAHAAKADFMSAVKAFFEDAVASSSGKITT